MNIKIVNKNGVTLRTEGKYCSEDINVTIDPSLLGSQFTTEEKTFTPTTSVQTYTPTSGVYVSKVTVNAMPTGKAATPATTITAAPTISVSSSGLITASASATKSVTPTITSGYVSSGTSGTITVSGSATKQLTTKAATTYTPTTANQTIAASTYLTGVQTIKGDRNLIASNIKSGTSIFGVTGTYEGSGGGGSLETCTVTFALDGPFMVGNVFIATYMNSSSQIVTTEISIGDSITCLKNSIIAVQNCPFTTTLSGGLSEIFYAQLNWAIQVSSDGTLYIAG